MTRILAFLVMVLAVWLVVLSVMMHRANRRTDGASYRAWEARMEADSLRVVADKHLDLALAQRARAEAAEARMDSITGVVADLKARRPVIHTTTNTILDALRDRPAPLDSLWGLLVPEP